MLMGIDMTRWDTMFNWETLASSRGKVETNDLASVEVSWLCRRLLNMHAQAVCVVEQAWIPHKQCSISEDKSR